MKHRLVKTSLTSVLLAILLAGALILGQPAGGFLGAGAEGLALRSNGRIVNTSPSISVYQYILGPAFWGMAEHVNDWQVLRDFLAKAALSFQDSIALNPLESHTWPGLAFAANLLPYFCKVEGVAPFSISLTLPGAFNISTSFQHVNKYKPVWKPCPPGNFLTLLNHCIVFAMG